MTARDRMKGYEAFSKFYADSWSEEWANRIQDGVLSLLRRTYPAKKHLRILDVACGAGHAASFLERAGHSVVGIDGSKALLRIARKRAPKSTFIFWQFGEPLPVLPPFDAVFCFYDSLNHAADPATVRHILCGVAGALRPDGLFLCDYNSPRGFAKRWSFTVRIDRAWGWCESRFSFDPLRKRGTMRAKGVLHRRSGNVRFNEEYTELPIRRSDMSRWMNSAGFRVKEIPQSIQSLLPFEPGREWVAGSRVEG